jgi:hypothetical protein
MAPERRLAGTVATSGAMVVAEPGRSCPCRKGRWRVRRRAARSPASVEPVRCVAGIGFPAFKLQCVDALSGIHRLTIVIHMPTYGTDQIRWTAIIDRVVVVSGALLAAMEWIANQAKAQTRAWASRS